MKRSEYFAKVGLGASVRKGFDPAGWLSNFRPEEQRHALYLLNAFLYLSEEVVKRVFVETVHGLSYRLAAQAPDAAGLRTAWSEFLDKVIFVPIRGETFTREDSGALFTRWARDLFDLPADRVPDEPDAIQTVLERPDTPVVFVDDFVGTGSQFVLTFKHGHAVSGEDISFEDLAANGLGTYFCCPVVACARGAQLIARKCPTVVVSPGYELPDAYSAFAPDSIVWPDPAHDETRLAETAEETIRTASLRAGIPDEPGSQHDWRGYGNLGLALGFEHGRPPDATLPLFTWAEGDWRPLVRMATR